MKHLITIEHDGAAVATELRGMTVQNGTSKCSALVDVQIGSVTIRGVSLDPSETTTPTATLPAGIDVDDATRRTIERAAICAYLGIDDP